MMTGYALEVRCWGHRQVINKRAQKVLSGQTEVRSSRQKETGSPRKEQNEEPMSERQTQN